MLGKRDGDKQTMAGKDKTLVYLLWDAMFDNREKRLAIIHAKGRRT